MNWRSVTRAAKQKLLQALGRPAQIRAQDFYAMGRLPDGSGIDFGSIPDADAERKELLGFVEKKTAELNAKTVQLLPELVDVQKKNSDLTAGIAFQKTKLNLHAASASELAQLRREIGVFRAATSTTERNIKMIRPLLAQLGLNPEYPAPAPSPQEKTSSPAEQKRRRFSLAKSRAGKI
jgi:hypothetical protein